MTSESVPNAEASTSASLPERPGLMMGLASFALVTSLIPILSLPAAVGALVMAIRRAKNPNIRFSVLAATAMAAISIPVALVSAVDGVMQANAFNQINRVHLQMDRVMAVEIQSGKHIQQMVQQLAKIDVSACPEDYQEVYAELIGVMTDLAFYAAQNEDIGKQILIFVENLLESFGGDMSGLGDIRLQDEELMRRMNQVENKLRLVCAKYGVVMAGPAAPQKPET
jgi:hypothetical protein